MKVLDYIFEVLSTFGEVFLLMLIIASITGWKYYDRVRKYIGLIAIVVLYTIIITICNSFAVFSFYTVAIAGLLTLMLSYVIAQGSFHKRMMAISLAILQISTLEYSIGFGVALLICKSSDVAEGLVSILSIGWPRRIYAIIDKLIQFGFYMLLQGTYRQLRTISPKKDIVLIFVLNLASVISQVLAGMILAESTHVSQFSLIVSWVFILACSFSVIIAICLQSKYQDERVQNEVISATNNAIGRGYEIIAQKNDELRKMIHDFKSELRMIQQLAPEDVSDHINSYLQASYMKTRLSNTGDRYVDAVLNAKLYETEQKKILLKYNAKMPMELPISSVDICALVSNLLDNAIEACEKIDDPRDRVISFTIDQKGDFLLIVVENSIVRNSMNKHDPLTTSKANDDHMHGLGLRSIKAVVDKYDGSFTYTVTEDMFVAKALLSLYRED